MKREQKLLLVEGLTKIYGGNTELLRVDAELGGFPEGQFQQCKNDRVTFDTFAKNLRGLTLSDRIQVLSYLSNKSPGNIELRNICTQFKDETRQKKITDGENKASSISRQKKMGGVSSRVSQRGGNGGTTTDLAKRIKEVFGLSSIEPSPPPPALCIAKGVNQCEGTRNLLGLSAEVIRSAEAAGETYTCISRINAIHVACDELNTALVSTPLRTGRPYLMTGLSNLRESIKHFTSFIRTLERDDRKKDLTSRQRRTLFLKWRLQGTVVFAKDFLRYLEEVEDFMTKMADFPRDKWAKFAFDSDQFEVSLRSLSASASFVESRLAELAGKRVAKVKQTIFEMFQNEDEIDFTSRVLKTISSFPHNIPEHEDIPAIFQAD